jgi:hypothetical protein
MVGLFVLYCCCCASECVPFRVHDRWRSAGYLNDLVFQQRYTFLTGDYHPVHDVFVDDKRQEIDPPVVHGGLLIADCRRSNKTVRDVVQHHGGGFVACWTALHCQSEQGYR